MNLVAFLSPPSRLITTLAALAMALSFVVAGLRIHTAWQAAGISPGTAETSGCEEESWLSLWNRLHGGPALRPVTESPFNYAYFNWAFYEAYRVPLGLAGAAEHPIRIIRGGRLLTVGWGLGGLLALAWLLRRIRPAGGPTWLIATFWASLAILCPIGGWFVTTVRPDVAAVTLEILALACAWRAASQKGIIQFGYIAMAGLCVYGAWAFKPSFIGAMSGIGLFYLVERRWPALVLHCAVVWGCTGLTFLLGGEIYREVILGTIFRFGRFDFATGWGAAQHAAIATSPLWCALLLLVVGWRFCPSTASNSVDVLPGSTRTALKLGLCCLGVALPLSAMAAFKIGAWSYYYMPALPAACLIAVALSGGTRLASAATAIAATLTIVLQAGLIFGAWGSISRKEAARELQDRWQEFSSLPEPRFSEDLRLNLPWLNPHSPPFVIAYDYPALRTKGVPFDGNGLGGAIGRGELASLYLFPPRRSMFDGASMKAFTHEVLPSGMHAYISR